MSSQTTVAEYLFTRLKQLGVGAIHGVPGDYNLTLLDYVEPSGLTWVGNCNELNAGYAADGYARIKGVGALITTFGVGELSAINAVAGAYAERAAVVHIVGTPTRAAQDGRLLVHHTLNDGDYRRFGLMACHVTVAQTRLVDPRTCAEQIDEVLRQCVLHSRPVYIEVPVDLVAAPVSAERLATKIRIPAPIVTAESEAAMAKVLGKIGAASRPVILVDGESRALGIVDEVQELVKSTGWPTWTTTFGKGLVNETLSNMHGVYRGGFDSEFVKEFWSGADLVLVFGPHFSSTNSYGFSSIPKTEAAICFSDTEIRIGSEIFRDIPAQLAISTVLKHFQSSKAASPYTTYPQLPKDEIIPFSEVSRDGSITQDKLWKLMAGFLQPGDIVFGETGTAGYGVRDMLLPSHTRLWAPITWLSIGYMLPACQGASLAQRELADVNEDNGVKEPRTILFIGDGSFQMTAQELSTIIAHNLNVIIFLINNNGYTIERCIHGLREKYNGVAPWRYLQAPSFFGAKEDVPTATAKSWGELENVLADEKIMNGKGLRMVEVFMDSEDVPTGVLSLMMEKEQVRWKGTGRP
ncbi:thiamine diphosphate-binding protein [Lophiotrema nucula]|uniref:Pyruvate decarboxylase n=1 Tax=Lophiotrema nucula TaxID=690887 RepID=A0A6A5YYG9_9PLEO|nr:thiamine diphosphate-binding protein [Lophiotrema nucula]